MAAEWTTFAKQRAQWEATQLAQSEHLATEGAALEHRIAVYRPLLRLRRAVLVALGQRH